MKHRFAALLLAGVMSLSLLAGCSNNNGPTTSEPLPEEKTPMPWSLPSRECSPPAAP